MTMPDSSDVVTLPPGWTVVPGRQAAQLVNGQSMNGTVFTLSNATNGASIEVFIPLALMTNTAAVAQQFNSRISDYQAILNLSNG